MSALMLIGFGAGILVRHIAGMLIRAWASWPVRSGIRAARRRPRSIDEAQSVRWDAEQLAAERLPFLLEAQREVDRFLPGTPPIAPPELIPAPAPARAAAEPAFYDIGDGLRWAVLSNHDLALAYWRARVEDDFHGSWVLGSIRRELTRRRISTTAADARKPRND